MALHHRLESRSPVRPVLVMALEGWIDAGFGAGSALAALLDGAAPTEPVVAFDPEELVDYRARRPIVRLVDGAMESLRWHQPKILLGRDGSGSDVLFLVGPEPDMRWGAFTAEVVELARSWEVRLVVGLGAFPAPVPHTRAIKVASTSPDPALAARVGYVSGAIEVPAGIQSAIEQAMGEAGIPSVGLWARVPHYVAAGPYPPAGAALVTQLNILAGLTFDTTALVTAGDAANRRIDEMVANSEDHLRMVRQLEVSVDNSEGNAFDLAEIPSGDEIAAELQRFLGDADDE